MENKKNTSNDNYTLYWWISEILVMGLFIAVLSLFNTDTCAVSYCDKQSSYGSDYCSIHKYRDNKSNKYSTYSNSKKTNTKKNNSSSYKKNSSSDYYDKKHYKNANDFADYWAEDFEEDDYDSLEDA